MNPLVVLTAVFAVASAAPSNYAAAPAGLAYAAHAPAAYVAHAPAVSVPAPYTTHAQGPAATSIHTPDPIITKQLHYGSTTYVSGHATAIHKPPTPVLPIAVPTALRGSVAYNAPITKTVSEPFIVNEPFPVERRVEVPYDVPVPVEQIVEVPVAVHVPKPYEVRVPVPVQGEPIVNVRQGAPIVHHTHSNVHAAPVHHDAGYAHVGYGHAAAGYAALPAVAVAADAHAY